MIQVDYAACYFAALLLLVLPLDWFASAVLASLVHELCHICLLYVSGGKIRKISIGISGCILETDRIEEKKQFFSILAGPAGSLSLLFLCRAAPKIAICGLFHGMYNLIPVLPLDGGRMLQLLLCRYFPERARFLQNMTAVGICIVFAVLGIWLSITVYREIWPVLMVSVWISRVLPRKTPCKPLKF